MANRELQELLDSLTQERFFGSVTLQFRNGQVVMIRREETLIPGESKFNRYGGTDAESRSHR